MKCSMHIHSDEGSDRFLHPFFPKKASREIIPFHFEDLFQKIIPLKNKKLF